MVTSPPNIILILLNISISIDTSFLTKFELFLGQINDGVVTLSFVVYVRSPTYIVKFFDKLDIFWSKKQTEQNL